MIMKKAEHLTSEGVKAIINIKASINRGLSTSLKQAFPGYIPVLRPLVVPQKLLIHPSWIAVEKKIFFSLASGDGSFMVKVTNSNDLKAGVEKKKIIFFLCWIGLCFNSTFSWSISYYDFSWSFGVWTLLYL